MVKAFIFDFDGVIVSSEAPRRKALQSLMTSHGIKVRKELWSEAPGRTTQSVMEQIIPNNSQLLEQLIKEYRTKYVKDITKFSEPISFTVDVIRQYKEKTPLAIASMSPQNVIETLTKHLGIFEKISLIVTREEVKEHKPHPEIYLLVAKKLGLDPKDCCVFEDTVTGFHAAINAGMECCVILNGFNQKKDFAGLPVKGFISNKSEFEQVIHTNI